MNGAVVLASAPTLPALAVVMILVVGGAWVGAVLLILLPEIILVAAVLRPAGAAGVAATKPCIDVVVGFGVVVGSAVDVVQHFAPVPHEAGQRRLVASPCCACVQ
jgi:hypothetical protein